ncbi:serine hydrolase [Bremerella cremea]|uniref:serine hydrolase domain-containing protein n=1 Tax=Bremerella cremea TaxID=1031537 RepID=UPI0031F09A78
MRWAILLCLLSMASHNLAADDTDLPQTTPNDAGIDCDVLCEMSQWIRREKLDVRAMVLLRDGKLVMEWYAADVTREHNHNTFSVTKSVAATLAGIAIHECDVPGVDATLDTLLSQSKNVVDADPKQTISLKQLLTMSSGFPVTRGNRPNADPLRQLFDQVHNAPDRNRFVLGLPLDRSPGSSFAYNNNDPQLVAAIVHEAYDANLVTIAEQKLFTPLQFHNAVWMFRDGKGNPPGGYGLRLRAIDMAKLGQLYLQQGRWNGETIFDAALCREATSDQTGTGYGYFWWTAPDAQGEKSFAAKGVRGQLIYVDPATRIVFAVASDLPPEKVRPVMAKLTKELLPKAVSSWQATENNLEAEQRWEAELAKAAQYRSQHRDGLPAVRLPQLAP